MPGWQDLINKAPIDPSAKDCVEQVEELAQATGEFITAVCARRLSHAPAILQRHFLKTLEEHLKMPVLAKQEALLKMLDSLRTLIKGLKEEG